jgi:hypothetical protein
MCPSLFEPRASKVYNGMKVNTEVVEQLNKRMRNMHMHMGLTLCLMTMTQFHFVEFMRHMVFLHDVRKMYPDLKHLPGHGPSNVGSVADDR